MQYHLQRLPVRAKIEALLPLRERQNIGDQIPQPQPETRPGQFVIRPAGTLPIHSALDRASLSRIATAGGGLYRELDRESDQEISNLIVDAARRRAGTRGAEAATEELYWRLLLAAAIFIGLGVVFLQERSELWLQAAGTAATLIFILSLTR